MLLANCSWEIEANPPVTFPVILLHSVHSAVLRRQTIDPTKTEFSTIEMITLSPG